MHSKKKLPFGILEIICGPMFSGKSEELIRRLRRAKIANQGVAAFKHSLDNRYAIECLVSHNGNTIDAYPIDHEEKIYTLVSENKIDIIGIDEAQFFSNELIQTVLKLIENRKRVIIAGLDRDFRGIPFGCMPVLLAIADKVTKLQAICTICGVDATLSQRLVDNKPAKYNDPIVVVGAQETYQARCRSCYTIDKMPSL
ncbi:thymidine kinase [Candidatus Dependentiae bacterium]|nr:thymidine kinase [Candidatus Dependentiae bacterium]